MAGGTRFDHAQNQSTFQLRNCKAPRSLTCLCSEREQCPRSGDADSLLLALSFVLGRTDSRGLGQQADRLQY
jgi:hypothetical protein